MKAHLSLLAAFAAVFALPAFGQKLDRPELALLSPVPVQTQKPVSRWAMEGIERKYGQTRPEFAEAKTSRFAILASLEESAVISFVDRTVELKGLEKLKDKILPSVRIETVNEAKNFFKKPVAKLFDTSQ